MDENNVNQFAKSLGLLLINSGMKMIQSAFHLDPVGVGSAEITQIVRKYFPVGGITHLDGFYRLIPIGQWRELIRVDWTDTKKWVLDYFDCDNFAKYFSSNISMFYEINSAGEVYGKLYKPNAQGVQEFVDYHYFNVLITAEKDIWFFEPGSDKMTEAKYEGGVIMIGGNKYEAISFRFG